MQSNTILITGAAGTIGRAAAELLSLEGYRLLLVDKEKTALEQLAASLPHAAFMPMDVTDPLSISELFDQTASELAGVVLAAGIEGPISILEDCTDEAFHAVMATNVTSVWLGIKHALRIFKPRKKGNIIVLSSISGITAMPLLSPYCASKHAVMGLVKTAAREAAQYGIRINAVCPGPVQSSMMGRIDAALVEHYPERLNQHQDATHAVPMKRYATPEEIAKIISFFCSDASSYCTGMTMTVDGGLTCK